MKRAYSLFEMKSFDDAGRRFEGIATTPTPDRMGDIVEPKGALFALPLPFLYQHDGKSPIGFITEAQVTDDGIRVKGEVASIDAPPTLKERLDVAWAEMKGKLVRGLSIGFNPLEHQPIKGTNGIRFKKWEFLELSLVTVPAQIEATLLTVKQFDARTRAALGQSTREGVRLLTTSPGASGTIAAHPGAVVLTRRS